MTVRELFDFIKGVRPGFAFSDAQMMVWLNEIEGKVQTDIMLLDPAVNEDGTVTGLVEYDVTTDMDTELIVPFPWNKLYRYFMLMSIDLYNGEFQRYGNSFAQFNEAYEEYAAWYAQNIAPANGLAVAHGYYLTAYQFAVKGGFHGTAADFGRALSGLVEYAEESEYWAHKSEQSAAESGWIHFEIDNNGYLVYTKTTNVTGYSFRLNDDGEMEVVYA